MSKANSEQSKIYDAFDLIKYAWEKKWSLIGVSALAAILAIFISLRMDDVFESTVVIIPAEKVAASRNLVETSGLKFDGGRGIVGYGHEEDGERILQILRSTHIRDYIIEKYNLMAHYEIFPDDEKFPRTKLFAYYEKNINFKQTQFQAVEITVKDKVPTVAANIADDIAQFVDSTVHKMQKDRTLEGLRLVEIEYQTAKDELKILGDSLQKIQKLGVIDYNSQAAALNQAYAQALAKGNNSSVNSIQKKLNILARYGVLYVEVSEKFNAALKRQELLKDKLTLAKVDVEQVLPQVYIVDKADVAEKKSEPRRSIIVFMSTVSTFAILLLLLIVYDKVKAKF